MSVEPLPVGQVVVAIVGVAIAFLGRERSIRFWVKRGYPELFVRMGWGFAAVGAGFYLS